MREHDHINQHSNRNENQMHHRESSRSKRSSNNSQSDDYRSYNNKSNSRMKLQSERLKSNSKPNPLRILNLHIMAVVSKRATFRQLF